MLVSTKEVNMVATRRLGKIKVIKPYKTKASATRTLKRLGATRTHMVVLTRKGEYTLRKKTKRR